MSLDTPILVIATHTGGIPVSIPKDPLADVKMHIKREQGPNYDGSDEEEEEEEDEEEEEVGCMRAGVVVTGSRVY
jgi:hypothetical protein